MQALAVEFAEDGSQLLALKSEESVSAALEMAQREYEAGYRSAS
jgi:hypothetical protein